MTPKSERLPERRFHHTLVRALLYFALRLAFRFYGRWKVIGRENVPRTGALLFAANHASYVDPMLAWAAVYSIRRMWGIAKVELWKPPVMAYLMRCIDSIPVNRNTADRAMLRSALEVLERGEAVGIFPEGTRTHDGLLNPALPGLALLAQKADVPIVPVALIGTYEMWPRNRKSFKRVPLTVVFGTPLVFPPKTPREEIGTTVMREIAALMTAHGCPTEPPSPERAALLAAQED